jgi:hypothetical protein
LSTTSAKPRALRTLPSTELEQAIGLVNCNYGASEKLPPIEIDGHEPIGNLFTFTKDEFAQLMAIHALVVRYVCRRSPSRPLCLAVFGPPGSGKSFAVKQIAAKVLTSIESKQKLPLTTVNLTQVSDPSDLGRVLARIAGDQNNDTVPIVLFDEFDAPRNGASYGWLQWFLAPMHDGDFLHEGAVIRLKRAVYVFAGGTAATMKEFAKLDSVPAFRSAKGPDFVSRLRGFLDVQGPNAAPRELRRAIIFRTELEDRATKSGEGAFKPNRELLEALLQVGRYRHGARSIAALIELSDIDTKKGSFDWAGLPEEHLLALHIDRGPLDSKLIGGSIALNGYELPGQPPPQARGKSTKGAAYAEFGMECWFKVADELWRQGATLSYSGSCDADEGFDAAEGFIKRLASELKLRPVEPRKSQVERERPDPWLESFLARPIDEIAVDRIISQADRNRYGWRVKVEKYVTNAESAALGNDRWSIQVIEVFRLRLAVSHASVARFAVGGSTKDETGRVPGICEEVMLSLALGKPVYVAGGFGGAALALGSLLELENPRTGNMWAVPDEESQGRKLAMRPFSDMLRPPLLRGLPATSAEVASFLQEHAIGGPRWPHNGLTIEENRRLFKTTNIYDVAELVTKGLLQCFATR